MGFHGPDVTLGSRVDGDLVNRVGATALPSSGHRKVALPVTWPHDLLWHQKKRNEPGHWPAGSIWEPLSAQTSGSIRAPSSPPRLGQT